MEKCCKCGKKAGYAAQHGDLCGSHFLRYLEKKINYTIKDFKLIKKSDVVCVAASGGKDSTIALDLVSKYCEKRRIKFFAITVNEGIKRYREETIKDLQKFCRERKIELKQISYKKEFGMELDKMILLAKKKGWDKTPCSICGILRRGLLNRYAKNFGATKLVTGHNADDEAQSILMNQFKANKDQFVRLGPATGILREEFVQRIKPLYLCLEKEVELYAKLKKYSVQLKSCPYSSESFRNYVKKNLWKMEKDYPGTTTSILQTYLHILPTLKKEFIHNNPSKKLQKCKLCGQPSSQETCSLCKVKDFLGVKG